MAKLPTTPVATTWATLKWQRDVYERTNSITKPLAVRAAPAEAGLYRMTWTGITDWELLAKVLPVKASLQVPDRVIDFADRTPPVLLTIGRTTNIYNRLRQHFSTNRHSNRVLARFGLILPSLTQDDIRELARINLSVEWVPVACWAERCILEQYGLAIGLPLFDLDAEH